MNFLGMGKKVVLGCNRAEVDGRSAGAKNSVQDFTSITRLAMFFDPCNVGAEVDAGKSALTGM
jgi:hypothetical protein